MREKTENMDIIVDKKTVRVTTAVFVTVMTMLAAIAEDGNRSNVLYDHVRSGSRCRKLIEFPEHHQYNRAGLP